MTIPEKPTKEFCIQWILDNLRACEQDRLTEIQKTLFLDFLEQHQNTDIVNAAFDEFWARRGPQ